MANWKHIETKDYIVKLQHDNKEKEKHSLYKELVSLLTYIIFSNRMLIIQFIYSAYSNKKVNSVIKWRCKKVATKECKE